MANLTKLESDKEKRGPKEAANMAKASQGIYRQRQNATELARIVISGSNRLKGGNTFATFAIFSRKTTLTVITLKNWNNYIKNTTKIKCLQDEKE